MTELTVQGLHKAFGPHPAHPVLAGLDLSAPSGSLTAILGPSGSGKSTLLRVVAGFEQADAGTVQIGPWVVDGPGRHVPPEKRRIGYVPQEGSLFPHLTVAANVGFGLPPRSRRGPRVGELLEAVGLAGLGKRYPHQLSGGQQQRVALARALAIEPSLVLLDEPFAALDAHLRASVRADVQSIFRSAGTTAILVTHDQDEALSMADRVAVLRDGRIAQCAAPQDLYVRPADPQLAEFIGDANLLDGELVGGMPGSTGSTGSTGWTGWVRTMFGDLPLAGDGGAGAGGGSGRVTVLVRPEQLEVRSAQALNGACAQALGVAGQVVACEYYGHDAVLRVRPGGGSGSAGASGATSEIIVRTAGGPSLPPGADVLVQARGPVLAWPRA